MKRTKALIYTRFSPRPEDQLDKCASSETQAEACRKRAESMGYDVVGIYSDEGVSRNSLERPESARCIANVKRGTVVLAYHPDRVGSPEAAAVFRMEIEKAGGRLEYVDDAYNGDTPEAMLLRGFMHLIAEHQRASIAIRTSAGMRYRQRRGELMTHPSRVPFGRKMHPDDPTRTIADRHEMRTLREMLELDESGLSPYMIAKTLNERGIPTRSGGQWRPTTVRRILKRERDTATIRA